MIPKMYSPTREDQQWPEYSVELVTPISESDDLLLAASRRESATHYFLTVRGKKTVICTQRP